jgi:hypothetical protein
VHVIPVRLSQEARNAARRIVNAGSAWERDPVLRLAQIVTEHAAKNRCSLSSHSTYCAARKRIRDCAPSASWQPGGTDEVEVALLGGSNSVEVVARNGDAILLQNDPPRALDRRSRQYSGEVDLTLSKFAE